MEKKIEVGILGATGTVGQRFVQLLENHPWFELTWVAASDRSAGKRYGEAMSWQPTGAPPSRVADMTVEECVPGKGPRLVFSSMASALAGEIEAAFAQAGHLVVSNSGHFRMAADVPLLVPEINPQHLGLLPVQRRERGWAAGGGIVTNPNCAAVVIVLPFAALARFGLKRAVLTTFQAVSGAGYPGSPRSTSWATSSPISAVTRKRRSRARSPRSSAPSTTAASAASPPCRSRSRPPATGCPRSTATWWPPASSWRRRCRRRSSRRP